MSWFFPRTQRVLGIDIASQSLNLIGLSKAAHGHQIDGFVVHRTPFDLLSDGFLHDLPLVADMLTELLKQIKTACKQVIFAIPDACTLCKIVKASRRLRPEQVLDFAYLEMEKLLPKAQHHLYLDYQWCDPGAGEGLIADVMIVASRCEYIDERVELARRVGLHTKAVTIESLAMQRVVGQHEVNPLSTVRLGRQVNREALMNDAHDLLTAYGLALSW